MKSLVLIAAVAVILINGAALVPALQPYASYAPLVSLAIGVWLLLRVGLLKTAAAPAPEPAKVVSVEKPKAEISQDSRNGGDVAAVTLLGLLQEKGRFVDFVMDDIAGYSDAQVGSAARVVHQGCKSVLDAHFEISPVSEAKEGGIAKVPADASSGAYSLSGKIVGTGPFSGTLLHKGWKTSKVKLPRVINVEEGQLPAIAPAQVEVK